MSAPENIGKKVTVKDLNLQLKILLEKISKLEKKKLKRIKNLKTWKIQLKVIGKKLPN